MLEKKAPGATIGGFVLNALQFRNIPATPDPENVLVPELGVVEPLLADFTQNVFSILNTGTPAILAQTAWFVDSVNGSNTNDGLTAATAVQTFQEVVRRWGPSPVLKAAVTVTILSAFLATGDRIAWEAVDSDSSAHGLLVKGTRTTGTSLGAITAVSAINHSAVDGALYVTIGATNWTGVTRVRIVGGARDGACAFVMKPNTAAGQARLSPFTLIPAGNIGPMTSAQIVTPVNGDVVAVETVTATTNIANTSAAPLAIVDGEVPFVFDDVDFRDDSGGSGQQFASSMNNLPTMNRCQYGGAFFASGFSPITMNGCRETIMISASAQTTHLACGVFGAGTSGMVSQTSLQVDLDTTFQGCGITCGGLIKGTAVLGDVWIYDLASASVAAIRATQGASVVCQPGNVSSSTGTIGGTGNTGFTFKVQGGSQVYLANAALILLVGTASLTNVSGVNRPSPFAPLDNHQNGILSLDSASATTSQQSTTTYPVTNVLLAAGVVLANVASLAAFTVAGNDGNTYVQGQIVVLLAQTTASQNGIYTVGVVGGGTAPLTRLAGFETGALIVPGFMVGIQTGTLYGGCVLKSFVTNFTSVYGTNDPLFIPNLIVQSVTLGAGTINITNVPIRVTTTKVGISYNRTTPNNTATTVQYNSTVITAGSLGSGAPSITYQAQIAAGTIQNTDTSVLQVAIAQW